MAQKVLLSISVFLFTVIFSINVNAQAITPQEVLKAWDKMTIMVVESAKLMPLEDFQFTPGEPLRNFADQLNHTTASNIGFASSVKSGAPNFQIPDRNNPPQSKNEGINFLETSFQYYRSGLETLTQEDLEDKVLWGQVGNQREISRLQAILIVTSHLQREHGKTMMYLRAKGIKPAPAGSW